jgi:hypothetical protein
MHSIGFLVLKIGKIYYSSPSISMQNKERKSQAEFFHAFEI